MSSDPSPTGSATYDLVVAGGGAAGFFGAITAAETRPGSRVLIVEKAGACLGKVKISGGGRCNVTHACFDPKELSTRYPRGANALIGPFHRWGPADTIAWFEGRGVPLKTEADGRMFPESDSSQSIIDCLSTSAGRAGVTVRTRTALDDVTPRPDGGFDVALAGGETLHARRVLLTLGGTRNPIGADLAARLGHRVVPAAPSLFTFKIRDPRIDGLPGLSVADATVRIPKLKLESRGPVLITHWGLSGPGILRISAWAARELHVRDYRFEVAINWAGVRTEQSIRDHFSGLRTTSPRRQIANDPQFDIPSRLWTRLVGPAGDGRWPHLSKDEARTLAATLGTCRFSVDGKSMNKDEFVTCGGVDLRDVDLRTMESRKVPGLHFAGEILDVDGITGGFNFQAAWTTARIAGEAAVG